MYLHVFLLYIDVIISYSSKSLQKWVLSCVLLATKLKITQTVLHVVAVKVQTLHFNVCFLIKYNLIYVVKTLINQDNIFF